MRSTSRMSGATIEARLSTAHVGLLTCHRSCLDRGGGRRANGDQELPSGAWEASYRDPGGRERVKYHRTRAEADRWLTSVKNQLNNGSFVDPRLGRSPFSRFATEWLQTSAHLKPGTRVGYESMLRVHVLPAFGGRHVGSIQTSDVRRFIADKVADGVAPGTIRSARARCFVSS